MKMVIIWFSLDSGINIRFVKMVFGETPNTITGSRSCCI